MTNSTENITVQTGALHTMTEYIDNDVDHQLLEVLMPCLFAVILIIGLIGNGCVISSVLRFKSMRSAPNLFIVNLAIGDVLVLLICVPISGSLYVIDSWPFGEVICKLSYFTKTLSFGVSIFTLTALSIDRVMVIANTMKTLQEKSSTRITIMVAIVWLAAVLFAIPDAISYHVVTEDDNESTVTYCLPHPDDWSTDTFNYKKAHVLTHFTIFFAIPLIIIAICYGVMANIMVKSSKCLPGESLRSSSWRMKQMQTRKRVATIVVALVVLFVICRLPKNIFMMVPYLYTEPIELTPELYYFRMLSYCLTFLNSCINPIALYFLSKAFKNYYKRQLCCGRLALKVSDTDALTKQSHTQQGDCHLTNLTTHDMQNNSHNNNNKMNNNTTQNTTAEDDVCECSEMLRKHMETTT